MPLAGFSWLRAIAALTVILYHLNQHRPTSGLSSLDWSIYQTTEHLVFVVSVFFMLSGFFRAFSYYKCADAGKEMPGFWTSLRDRWLRIAPAYYVMLVVSLIISLFLRGTEWVSLIAWLSGFAFLNWVSADTFFPVLLNWPLWFISFDMIGWIFTSVVMMGYMRVKSEEWKVKSISYWLSVVLTLLILHFAWISLPWPAGEGIAHEWFPTYNPFLFALHFLAGIAAAGVVTWLRKKNQLPHIGFDVALLGTVAILIGSLYLIRESADWSYSWPIGPYHFPWVTFLIAFIMVALPYTRYIGRWLDSRFLSFTAWLSYSLFLVHMVVIELLIAYVFTMPLTFGLWIWLAASTLVFSYAFAYLLSRYVESRKW
jgi:peptidoglycan/LPS O-acetylase OafA/YrhL